MIVISTLIPINRLVHLQFIPSHSQRAHGTNMPDNSGSCSSRSINVIIIIKRSGMLQIYIYIYIRQIITFRMFVRVGKYNTIGGWNWRTVFRIHKYGIRWCLRVSLLPPIFAAALLYCLSSSMAGLISGIRCTCAVWRAANVYMPNRLCSHCHAHAYTNIVHRAYTKIFFYLVTKSKVVWKCLRVTFSTLDNIRIDTAHSQHIVHGYHFGG